MATIYIPVEVPDDEVGRLLGIGSLGGVLVASSVPTQPAAAPGMVRTESEFGYQVSPAPQPQDPWASPATTAPSTAAPVQPAPTYSAGAAQPMSQGGAPACAHGPMRYVPAGYSKATGKAYQAFYGCSAGREVPKAQQCKSVKAGQ